MCSSNVSDTANRLRKTRKKKSSAVPSFRSGHMSAICARLSKGKGRFTRGWKPQVSALLCARAASAQFRSLLKRHSPVRERSENHRLETVGVYPLARRRGCGEPPRQRLAPIPYAQEAAKRHLSRVNAQKSKNIFYEARMRAISSRKSCSEHR